MNNSERSTSRENSKAPMEHIVGHREMILKHAGPKYQEAYKKVKEITAKLGQTAVSETPGVFDDETLEENARLQQELRKWKGEEATYAETIKNVQGNLGDYTKEEPEALNS